MQGSVKPIFESIYDLYNATEYRENIGSEEMPHVNVESCECGIIVAWTMHKPSQQIVFMNYSWTALGHSMFTDVHENLFLNFHD